MRIRHRFPHAVREVEHLWIPLADGTRLAARLWCPESAAARAVPALVEYLPYRKRDGTRERDEPLHGWLAGHGFACLRVDLRGCGESEGVLRGEYTEQELADGLELLRWIAAQRWCNGRVGVLGKSWGGFNALQLAARAPPELGAVVSVCASDDRYADDAHYMGGCLLGENATWGALLFTLAALPPDPALVGEGWRASWRARLEASEPFPARWMRHPTRDGFWRHGSVRDDPRAIRCPVLAVGGWADAYTNAVPRLLATLDVPRRGLVGPWAHVYPHEGRPGPAIGFLQELERWFSRWLRDEHEQEAANEAANEVGHDAGGAAREPLYRAWMQASVRPSRQYGTRLGRWVAEERWPSPRIEPRSFALEAKEGAPGLLRPGAPKPGAARRDTPSVSVCSPQTVGAAAGAWCAFGIAGDLPGDQREDDAGSACFDSEPLREPLELLGAPELELELASDRPAAFVVARLCELFPDGASARVSYGLLNLRRREGPERDDPLEPGRAYRVRLVLNELAHAFAPESRLRLALSSAYWPIVWPAPEPVRLSVRAGACVLRLPVRPPHAGDASLRAFEPAEGAPSAPARELDPGAHALRAWNEPDGTRVLELALDRRADGAPARSRYDALELTTGHSLHERWSIHPDDPLSATLSIRQDVLAERGAWSTRVATTLALSATATHFSLRARLEAHEGERLVFERDFDERIPR